MIIYLAEVLNRFGKELSDENFVEKIPWFKDLYVLESYEYARKFKNPKEAFSKVKGIILDSGAFSYQKTTKESDSTNWSEYATNYANFIKENNIEKYFELDIDNLVDYREVLRLREKIENVSGKRTIPVWHISRGKEEYIRMCKEYDYIALGGLVGKNVFKGNILKYLLWFVNTAHEYNTKIHGLGVTVQNLITQIPFDSVDSTTWMCGAKYGELHYFEDGKMKRLTSVIDGQKVRKLKDIKQADLQNLYSWYLMQKKMRFK